MFLSVISALALTLGQGLQAPEPCGLYSIALHRSVEVDCSKIEKLPPIVRAEGPSKIEPGQTVTLSVFVSLYSQSPTHMVLEIRYPKNLKLLSGTPVLNSVYQPGEYAKCDLTFQSISPCEEAVYIRVNTLVGTQLTGEDQTTFVFNPGKRDPKYTPSSEIETDRKGNVITPTVKEKEYLTVSSE